MSASGMVRNFWSVFIRVERMVERVNHFLAVVYISLALCLISVLHYLYFRHLFPLLSTTLPRTPFLVHTTVSIYLLFSITINYMRCLITPAGSPARSLTTSSTKSTISSSSSGEMADFESGGKTVARESGKTRSETWRYCTICRCSKPPRTHHCSTCKRCFFKLCHHCPALGRCIGLQNYAFYMRMVVHSWYGGFFCAFTAAYLSLHVDDKVLQERKLYDILFFCIVVGCAVGVAMGVLGAWHLYLMLTGQTTIEWVENLQMKRRGEGKGWGWGGPFSRGIVGNLKDVFGNGRGGLIVSMLLPVGRRDCSSSWEDVD